MDPKEELTKRRFLIWLRQWLKSSRPTEWISSVSSFLAVTGGIVTGIIILNNGYFDAKKSETEAKNLLLKIETDNLEKNKLRLAETITGLERDKSRLDGEVSRLTQNLESYKVYEKQVNDWAITIEKNKQTILKEMSEFQESIKQDLKEVADRIKKGEK